MTHKVTRATKYVGLVLLGACLSLLGAIHALAAPSAEGLLLKALRADERVDYAGTQVLFTWASGSNEATAVRVYHSKSGATRWEYIGSDREPYLVVVDDGRHRWHYQPDEKLMSVSASASREADESAEDTLNLLRRNYHLQYGGSGEVAGRPVDVVELLPQKCAHVAQRLWVDRESGVVLRTERYRLDGSIASMSIYIKFALWPSLGSGQFKLSAPSGTRVVDDSDVYAHKDLQALRDRGIALSVPTELPTGFEYLGSSLTRPGDVDVIHIRFTDGLNVISLFEQAAKPGVQYVIKGGKRITLKNGSGYVYEECSGYLLNWTMGSTNYTLVGEVPVETLIELANSIPPAESAGPVSWLYSQMRRLIGR